MSVVVLIPWRDAACKHRERALTWVIAQLAQHGWPVVIGHHEDGPWCKAQAVNAALAQTDAATLIIADADVWTEGLTEAVQRVQDGAPWCVPHRGVQRLTERATDRLLTLGECDTTDLVERPYLGVEGGGIVVLPRATYEACPLDPRFAGWSAEDESWGWALRTLHGPPHRVKRALVHLWHPPQERVTRSRGSAESWSLRKRYARAIGRPDVMRTLIEEGRAYDAECAPESQHHDYPPVR